MSSRTTRRTRTSTTWATWATWAIIGCKYSLVCVPSFFICSHSRISTQKNITKAKKGTKRNKTQVDLTSNEGEPTVETTFDDDFQRMAFKGFQALEPEERAVQPVAVTCYVTGSTPSPPPPPEPVVNTKRTKSVKLHNNPATNTRTKVVNPARNTRSQKRTGIWVWTWNDVKLSLNFEMMWTWVWTL